MHLYLTGFMGVGKTTLGKRLALALRMPFIDTDALVEQQAGLSIEQIFETLGEETFRAMETEALHSISNTTPAVIATGGGLPCYNNNMDFLVEHGFTIYVKAEPAFILSRLERARKPRPLIKSLARPELLAFIEQKIKEREPCYKRSLLEISLPQKSLAALINRVTQAYSHYKS